MFMKTLPPIKKLFLEAESGTAVTPPPSKIGSGANRPLSTRHVAEIKKLLEKYLPRLKEKGIPVSDTIPTELGHGTYGVAFDLGSSVLKVTLDRTEANAANRIKGKKLSNVYEIYKVYQLNESEYYIIWQEKLMRVGTAMNSWMSYTMSDFLDNNYKPGDDVKKILTDFRFDWMAKGGDIDTSSYKEKSKVTSDVVGGVDALYKEGIVFTDWHGGNIMQRPSGDYVIIDVGVSRSAPTGIEQL